MGKQVDEAGCGMGGNDVLSWALLAADWAVRMWLEMDICQCFDGEGMIVIAGREKT
jgi:hypothetical protein